MMWSFCELRSNAVSHKKVWSFASDDIDTHSSKTWLFKQTAVCCADKLKFHWDQFPRNFPVANVMGKSPTSCEEADDFQTISTCQDGLATSPTSS